ncbi:GPP34 family phosphoprotein [Streptomyces sp. WMMC940]|uniref:GPP34 family phosphoprotein n=1 Tax=Streptomyces sp. WMMC940 TaxID=3015153 RepID=UPI0022B637C1|nr:GPP34 family phosphoprotein [Streptomyces sp. WMMC940]MCZ7457234.1 GPP34 family phosphoprotein [Streptomyces sp. WMMC940]
MTTARDLMIIAMDVAPSRPVAQGDLSLALAGAEVVDLLAAEAVTLDGDRIVPGLGPATDDPLLDRAVSSLVREAPYELVGDWLWRRGRGLSAAYLAALEAEGLFGRPRRRGLRFRAGRDAPADSADRRAAAERLASDEPVLAALASAVGIRDEGADGGEDGPDREQPEYPDDPEYRENPENPETGRNGTGGEGESGNGNGGDRAGDGNGTGGLREGSGGLPGVSDDVDTVIGAVLDALTQLAAIRQRRSVEQAAFDNIWRGD